MAGFRPDLYLASHLRCRAGLSIARLPVTLEQNDDRVRLIPSAHSDLSGWPQSGRSVVAEDAGHEIGFLGAQGGAVRGAARGAGVEIVIPVGNEERDLGPSVRRLHAYLRGPFPVRRPDYDRR